MYSVPWRFTDDFCSFRKYVFEVNIYFLIQAALPWLRFFALHASKILSWLRILLLRSLFFRAVGGATNKGVVGYVSPRNFCWRSIPHIYIYTYGYRAAQ